MILSGKAALAGVMGWPVGHSRSPRLHGYWLEQLGLDGAYLPLAVRPDDLESALRALPKLGFRGCNLTVPHKEAALGLCDEADANARRIGAVNTVVVGPEGSLRGRNTDAYGFRQNILQCVAEDGLDWSFDAGPAVVLGAGGAARAVLSALADAGTPEVRLVNRTRARAEALMQEMELAGSVHDWGDGSALEGANLLVNTTSLGMTGQPPLAIDLAPLPKQALVHDIVYAPLLTGLLEAARARGNPTVDGLGMLLHQAVPGFAAWFGTTPEVTAELRSFVLQD